jgi:hypothetical protein
MEIASCNVISAAIWWKYYALKNRVRLVILELMMPISYSSYLALNEIMMVMVKGEKLRRIAYFRVLS